MYSDIIWHTFLPKFVLLEQYLKLVFIQVCTYSAGPGSGPSYPVLLIRSFLPKVDNQLNELRKYSMCTSLNHSRWICLVKLYCRIVSKKTTIVYLLFCVYIYLLNLLTALFVIPTVLYLARSSSGVHLNYFLYDGFDWN